MELSKQEKLDLISHLISEGHSQTEACQRAGVPRTTYRGWRDSDNSSFTVKPLAAGTLARPHEKRKLLEGKRFVFTSAQNNTYVHEDFLKSLELYCSYNSAQLIVGTFLYNKNGFQSEKGEEEVWFDPKIRQYINNESCTVFDGLVWCGELNILPTAVNPLSGLSTYTKECSGIVPHTKVRLESLPTAKNEPCRMMYTTGCVTKANYIQKKEGQKAEFHHTYAAVVAEIDEEGNWFVRQLVSDSHTGGFYDLDCFYSPTGTVVDGVPVVALNYGDLHSEKPDTVVFEATFGEGGLLDTLRPEYQFCNDTLDFTVRNHHNIKDIYHRYNVQARYDGKDTVEKDIEAALSTFKAMSRDWCKTIVVESNHDLALTKWLKESDPKTDNIWNALFYHKCQSEVLKNILEGNKDFSIFEWVIRSYAPDLKMTFLKEDQSFIVASKEGGGIECGNHGHLGVNGSRGSVQNYVKMGKRQNIGHGHSATIIDGVYMAGIKGSLDQGYNKGGSSWSHSDIVTYRNAKRAMITFKNGKWRA